MEVIEIKTASFERSYILHSLITDKKHLGSAVVELLSQTEGRLKYIKIKAPFRGYGISSFFWKKMLSSLKRLGLKKIVLEAKEDAKRKGKLEQLYASWGFKTEGEREGTFEGQRFRYVFMILLL